MIYIVPEQHKYKCICRKLDCRYCGDTQCKVKLAKGIDQLSRQQFPLGSRSWIVHLTDTVVRDEINHTYRCIRELVRHFDQRCVHWTVFHGLEGDPHLNVLVGSKYLHPAYVSRQKKTAYTLSWLETELQELLKLPYVRRLESGMEEYQDNPSGWLRYMLRQTDDRKFATSGELGQGIDGRAFRRKAKRYR